MIVPGALQTIRNLKIENGKRMAAVLRDAGRSAFSERRLADMLLERQRSAQGLHAKGWYDPPPEGVISAFGKQEDNYQRIGAASFRVEETWPSSGIVYAENDIIAAYTSPVCKTTNLIGDFGLCLYRGDNPDIWAHFENVLRATMDIAALAKVGMPLSEVYERAALYMHDSGVEHTTPNRTSMLGANIGHTIPLSYKSDGTFDAMKHVGDFEGIRACIAQGRKFISSDEPQCIEDNMAFVIEPRMKVAGLPAIFFHVTVLVENGDVSICHGFDPVFAAFGMDRLTRFLPV